MTELMRPTEIHLCQACVRVEQHRSRPRQRWRIFNLLFCRHATIRGMFGIPKRKTIAGVIGIAVPVGHTDGSVWFGRVPDVPDPIRIFAHSAIPFFLVIVVRGIELPFLVEGDPVWVTDAPSKQLGVSSIGSRPKHAGAAP